MKASFFKTIIDSIPAEKLDSTEVEVRDLRSYVNLEVSDSGPSACRYDPQTERIVIEAEVPEYRLQYYTERLVAELAVVKFRKDNGLNNK